MQLSTAWSGCADRALPRENWVDLSSAAPRSRLPADATQIARTLANDAAAGRVQPMDRPAGRLHRRLRRQTAKPHLAAGASRRCSRSRRNAADGADAKAAAAPARASRWRDDGNVGVAEGWWGAAARTITSSPPSYTRLGAPRRSEGPTGRNVPTGSACSMSREDGAKGAAAVARLALDCMQEMGLSDRGLAGWRRDRADGRRCRRQGDAQVGTTPQRGLATTAPPWASERRWCRRVHRPDCASARSAGGARRADAAAAGAAVGRTRWCRR